MFRRAVLAVVSYAFTDGIERPQNQIFTLRRETRNELLALSCLGPVCMSDMRVSYAPFIFVALMLAQMEPGSASLLNVNLLCKNCGDTVTSGATIRSSLTLPLVC